MTRLSIVFFVHLLLLASFSNALPAGNVTPGNPVGDSVDALVTRVMSERHIPGLQLAVVKQGKILDNRCYGIANLSDSIPVTKNTVFSANSIAKILSGVAILQLKEAGKLSIDAPVSGYLDSLPDSWKKVTIRQLLANVSGIPDITDSITDRLISDNGEYASWQKVQALPMEFQTGEQFSYNTTNYLLIGKIIDKLGDMPFVEFFHRHQLATAGMKHTVFANSYNIIPHKAPTYSYFHQCANGRYRKTDKLEEAYEEFPGFLRTDAGMFTTATDLALWVTKLQTEKLLRDKKNIAEMWMPVKLNNGTYGGFGGLLNGYALGWPVILREKHNVAAAIGGGRAALFYYTADDLAIIVLTNLAGGNPELFIDDLATYYR